MVIFFNIACCVQETRVRLWSNVALDALVTVFLLNKTSISVTVSQFGRIKSSSWASANRSASSLVRFSVQRLDWEQRPVTHQWYFILEMSRAFRLLMTAGCCCGGAAVIDHMNSIFGSLQAVFPSINVLQNQIAAFDGSHTSPELLRVADNLGSFIVFILFLVPGNHWSRNVLIDSLWAWHRDETPDVMQNNALCPISA